MVIFTAVFILACRVDQIYDNCACGSYCDRDLNKPCDWKTCKKGCVCPNGLYDNGKACVKFTECFCTDSSGKIFQVSETLKAPGLFKSWWPYSWRQVLKGWPFNAWW